MNSTRRQNAQYKRLMLRLWREPATEDWRIAIQSVKGGQLQGLGSMEELVAYVQAVIDAENTAHAKHA